MTIVNKGSKSSGGLGWPEQRDADGQCLPIQLGSLSIVQHMPYTLHTHIGRVGLYDEHKVFLLYILTNYIIISLIKIMEQATATS